MKKILLNVLILLLCLVGVSAQVFDFQNGAVGVSLSLSGPDTHTLILSPSASLRLFTSTNTTLIINRIADVNYTTKPITIWNNSAYNSKALYNKIIDISNNPNIMMELLWDLNSPLNSEVLHSTVSWYYAIGGNWIQTGNSGISPYINQNINYVVAGFPPIINNVIVSSNLSCPPAQNTFNLSCPTIPAINVSCPTTKINLTCPELNTTIPFPEFNCPVLECPSPGSLTEQDRELVSTLIVQKIASQGAIELKTSELENVTRDLVTKIDNLKIEVESNKNQQNLSVISSPPEPKIDLNISLIAGLILIIILIGVGVFFKMRKTKNDLNFEYMEEI